MTFRAATSALTAIAFLSATASMAAEPLPPKAVKEPSLYVQCDGNPNNMAAGESIARLIALTAVIGLLAPSPEQPDASKRKFGVDGVAACNGILNGDKGEHNVVRRIPFILARALHNIEAKSYDAAIADVGVARKEAGVAGLVGNPYFDRSMGLSFDLIESQALLRQGKVEEAREVNTRSARRSPYSYFPLLLVRGMNVYSANPLSAEEEASLRNLSKISPSAIFGLAAQLDEARRFTESAAALKSLDDFQKVAYHDNNSQGIDLLIGTNVAVSLALAGDWTSAEAVDARNSALLATMRTEGKAIDNESIIIERMDFYALVRMMREGKLNEARRQFAARSRWTAPTFGQVLELNRRLRAGAGKEDLFGSLADDADAMIARRRQEAVAVRDEKDKNNKTLFSYILPYASVSGYERLSGRTWNAKGNRIISKDKRKDSEVYMLSIFDADPMTQPDILLLHAALQAKARGKTGLVFRLIPDDPRIAFVYFADKGEAGVSDMQYLDADAVIADLGKIIPSPADLKAREAQRLKARQ
ncbi:hypothetical protein OOT33_01610 [Sphingobium sp. DEHP117]|uniref:hypothetical protein n=1 Tax=Sphingobium sp. DEHP117 TaxID=2993436 RepID=UPI0027D59925|nr:hypothetical protein [Sphingobium sp. DEHP117]MDQ4419138.1 hypothetical protein [Sphingobium sp. DEHP117]